MFVDESNFDYHLQAGSPAIDAGTSPGAANGVPLKPFYEYVQPACGEKRNTLNIIDIGAYEYGGAGNMLTCR